MHSTDAPRLLGSLLQQTRDVQRRPRQRIRQCCLAVCAPAAFEAALATAASGFWKPCSTSGPRAACCGPFDTSVCSTEHCRDHMTALRASTCASITIAQACDEVSASSRCRVALAAWPRCEGLAAVRCQQTNTFSGEYKHVRRSSTAVCGTHKHGRRWQLNAQCICIQRRRYSCPCRAASEPSRASRLHSCLEGFLPLGRCGRRPNVRLGCML